MHSCAHAHTHAHTPFVSRVDAHLHIYCAHTHVDIYCNTLQCTVTQCITLQHKHRHTHRHVATHRNTPQHTTMHFNTLQHTAAHCNALQRTASHCITPHHMLTSYTHTHRPSRSQSRKPPTELARKRAKKLSRRH